MKHLKMTQQEKARIRAKEWYIKNRDKALIRIKAKCATPEFKEKKKAYDQKYKVLNQDKIEKRLAEWYKVHNLRIKSKSRVWKQKNPEKAQYNRYIERAKNKGGNFGIEFNLFLKIIRMPCVYCGFNDGIVGLDRIDSCKGYEKDNIVPCCKICNFMKLNYSLEDWITSMRDIFENLGYVVTPSPKNNSKE